MSGPTLAAVCQRARSDLASLGDLGTALVSTLGVVERTGRARGLDALDDPGFAIDVLTSQPGLDPALVGRVLDYLRSREAAPLPQQHRRSRWPTPSPATRRARSP